MWPERVRVAPFAYGARLPAGVPLLYRHRPREIAGEVLELTYDAEGALRVEARVELSAARSCNGFSIGLGPVDVEWFNVDDPRAFFVAITRVYEIREVSLTPFGRDPGARIQTRRPVNAYDNCFREVRKIRTLLAA
jgi:hypothetical protein